MAENKNVNMNIPKEKFRFVNAGEHLTDKKFDDKPISYFHDAFNRFCKNGASVAAAIIIVVIILYAFITPLVSTIPATFMDPYYAKKSPRNIFLRDTIGLADGGIARDFSDKSLVKALAIGIGAENYDGRGVTIEEGWKSKYQPVLDTGDIKMSINAKKQEVRNFVGGRIEMYLEVGFIYKSLTQAEHAKLLAWEEETGIKVMYPLINDDNTADKADANLWYKNDNKYNPLHTVNGELRKQKLEAGMILEDNYKRDAEGNLIYSEATGGGTIETAQRRVRLLYYNYYQYLNGFEPEYIFGTDSQGYDMAQRIAGGIKLSLLVAISVCLINFIIGALYGAVEGYYGGWTDIILERISDILAYVPFIVVATLFNIHLAAKVGALVSLIFAYVVTGWIGTAARVRSQFYRFKNQEYVMAARTLGARDRRIIWKHIFPNTLGTLITSSALAIPSTMLSESTLSFLGIVNLGSAEATSIGTLLADSQGVWTNAPHLMIVPAVVISLLMISFNLFGNGLRDAFNPSLRGVEE